VDKTKDILIQVQDIGRRLTGMNVDLPVDIAFEEIQECRIALDELELQLITRRALTELREADDSTDGDTA
jgi:hypothetical protein